MLMIVIVIQFQYMIYINFCILLYNNFYKIIGNTSSCIMHRKHIFNYARLPQASLAQKYFISVTPKIWNMNLYFFVCQMSFSLLLYNFVLSFVGVCCLFFTNIIFISLPCIKQFREFLSLTDYSDLKKFKLRIHFWSAA